MKHVMSDVKSLLVGDAAADLLVRYAVLIAQTGSADSVELAAIETSGNTTLVTFLLNSGVSLTVETTESELVAPDNAKAEQFMTSRIAQIERGLHPSADDILGPEAWDPI